MKKILVTTFSLVFLLSAFAVMAKGPKAQGPHEKATGDIVAAAGATSLTLVFDAHGTDPVKGNVVYTNSAGGAFGGVVDVCYSQEGNKAAFAGTVTEGNYSSEKAYFQIDVIDNGEGVEADPDQVRVRLFESQPTDCIISNSFPGIVFEGNLQVHKDLDPEEPTPQVMAMNAENGMNAMCTTIQSGELLASDGSTIETGFDDWGYNYQGHMFKGGYCDSYRDAAWCQPYKDVKLMMKWNDAWLSNKDCDDDRVLDRHYGDDSYIGSGAWITNHQSGEYYEWDVEGDWVFEYDWNGSKHPHDVHISELDEDGNFDVSGMHQVYLQTWQGSGSVIGDDFEMELQYDNSTYIVTVEGVIDEDGEISGSWESSTGQSGEWLSTEGLATKNDCPWNYFVKIVAAPADAYKDGGNWYTADDSEIGPVIWGSFAIIQQVENDECAGLHGMQYLSPTRAGLGNW